LSYIYGNDIKGIEGLRMRRCQLELAPFCWKLAQNVDNDLAYIVTKDFFLILINKDSQKMEKVKMEKIKLLKLANIINICCEKEHLSF
jgi:hypothetical protein